MRVFVGIVSGGLESLQTGNLIEDTADDDTSANSVDQQNRKAHDILLHAQENFQNHQRYNIFSDVIFINDLIDFFIYNLIFVYIVNDNSYFISICEL